MRFWPTTTISAVRAAAQGDGAQVLVVKLAAAREGQAAAAAEAEAGVVSKTAAVVAEEARRTVLS